jgi:hypothetical protein
MPLAARLQKANEVPSGLKPARNDKKKDLYGTAEAMPLQSATSWLRIPFA